MKRLLLLCFVFFWVFQNAVFASARIMHSQPQQTPSTHVEKLSLNDLQELKEFVDKYFIEAMDKEKVPGVAVVVVKDGKIYFQQGYGYADVEKKIPVVPEKTLFRVASISKLFTATAVMQLVEQDKINLKNPVNDYIKDFQLENKYSQPITVGNLLTHTSGLDVNDIGMSARTQNLLQPLGKHLANHKPLQILPAYTVMTYSNYGMALAGYVVERVSGVPFVEYIDTHILQPLGMRHSTFLQPPPPILVPSLAIGYEYKDNKYQPQPYTYEHQVPAIALSTTATDIANFMIAHLNQGRLQGTKILRPETVKEMHRQHFTSDARIPGIAYGFQEQVRNNVRIIRHGGLIEGFVSQLVLIPQDNTGVFIVCNSTSTLDSQFIREFLNRYYPIEKKPNIEKAKSLKRLAHLSGNYLDTITSQTTIEKFFEPYYFTVNLESDNILVYDSRKYIQIQPLLFLSVEGDKYISFKEDLRDHSIYLFDGVFTLRKMNWYENIAFQLFLCKIFFSIFLFTCLRQHFKLLLIYLDRRFKLLRIVHLPWRLNFIITESKSSQVVKKTELFLLIIVYLNLFFMVIGKLLIPHKQSDLFKIIYGINPIYKFVLSIPIISGGMTVIVIFWIGLIWKNKQGTWIQRVYYTFIAGAALMFLPFLNYWNLLGFKF